MIKSAKEAREIVRQFGGSKLLGFEKIHSNAIAYFMAEGYLAALNGREVKALVEALEETKSTMDRWVKEGIHGSKFNHESIIAHFERSLSQYREATK